MAILAGIAILSLQTFVAAQGEDASPDAVAIFNSAQDLHEKGDLAGAIALYDKALKALPEFPEAEYQRGVAELSLGNPEEAEKSFRRAIELKADWTLAMTSLGSLLVGQEKFGEADSILQKVIELEPQNPPALTALTELKLKTNAPPDILQGLLSRVSALTAKANPTASLWAARAALEDGLGKKDPANKSVANALAIDPNNKAALFQFADVALASSDIVRANEIAARLEKTSGSSDGLKLLKAKIFSYEGKTDDAIKQLQSMERLSPAAVDLRNRINASRTMTPAELEKQLETDAKDPAILGRLCAMYRRDDPAKALDYCRRASEAEPNSVVHAIGFGAALVQAKQFDPAVTLFRKILQIAPDNSAAHANLATALFQSKRYAEAKAEFLWLTNAQPKAAAAYYFLGIVHDQLEEFMDAMACYQEYLKLADPVANKLDIDKVNLRLPALQKSIKQGKGKKS
ncbi:MAG: tetratricopeptide repeat protein [Acidobacteriota bacterium]